MKNRTKATKRKLNQEIDEKLESNSEAINEEIRTKIENLKEEIDEKLEAKAETINEGIEAKTKQLKEEMDGKFKQIESKTEKIINDINAKLKEISSTSDSDNQDDETESGDDYQVCNEKKETSWQDMIGLDDVKNCLKEAVILPMRQPQLYKRW